MLLTQIPAMLPESIAKIHRAPESIRVSVWNAFHKMKRHDGPCLVLICGTHKPVGVCAFDLFLPGAATRGADARLRPRQLSSINPHRVFLLSLGSRERTRFGDRF
jgi:hypothetical protein